MPLLSLLSLCFLVFMFWWFTPMLGNCRYTCPAGIRVYIHFPLDRVRCFLIHLILLLSFKSKIVNQTLGILCQLAFRWWCTEIIWVNRKSHSNSSRIAGRVSFSWLDNGICPNTNATSTCPNQCQWLIARRYYSSAQFQMKMVNQSLDILQRLGDNAHKWYKLSCRSHSNSNRIAGWASFTWLDSGICPNTNATSPCPNQCQWLIAWHYYSSARFQTKMVNQSLDIPYRVSDNAQKWYKWTVNLIPTPALLRAESHSLD